MIEGNFIVIEGIDGVGKTTQCQFLRDFFRERGLPVHQTQEPSSGPIGVLLRQILGGRVVVPGLHGARPPSWNTMAALFAADRLDHLEAELIPNMMDGVTVICDRYDYSSVAFQTVSGGGDPKICAWVKTLNEHARRPDLTIILDANPKTVAQRRNQRASSPELYDDDTLQEELAAFYLDIDRHFPEDHIVHVDAMAAPEVVAASIAEHVRELRGEAPATSNASS